MKLLFLFALLLFATGVHAQATSSTWVDVTAPPYSAKNDCSLDAGPAINSAITNGPGNMTPFFPVGCYLISTQIQDSRTSGGTVGGYTKITYLGYGAEFRASSATPPSNSIIKFGDDSTTIRFRAVQGIYFNCNGDVIDGIDLDGLTYSEFDGITITQCAGTADMRTVGSNVNNYVNNVFGGYIYAPAPTTSGVLLGNGANVWNFYGTQIVAYNGTNSGIGIDFNGKSGGAYGVDVEVFTTSIRVGYSTGAQGITIAGSYIAGHVNNYVGILLGKQGTAGSAATGITITGNYILCNSSTGSDGVQIQQANGFSITGNKFESCASHAVNGYADGTNQGADNGLVGPNTITGNGVSLLGSNNTVTNSIVTKSANYTLNGADSWINITGNNTVTVPHAMTGQQWNVFNSGTGNVGLVCDSGTINGLISIQLSANTGKTVSTDGTNCFAH